jgi:hypothetical protein
MSDPISRDLKILLNGSNAGRRCFRIPGALQDARFDDLNVRIAIDADVGRWVECKAGYRELYEKYR